MGKGEMSEVRAHSRVRQRAREVNPVRCKEIRHARKGWWFRQTDRFNPLERAGNGACR